MRDQHFMIDKELLVRLTQIADLNRTDTVLEIGGGSGNLTEYLRKIADKVFVIERDQALAEQLGERFSNFGNVFVSCGNATDMIYPSFSKCVSNLPYTICEPLLWKFIREKFECLVFVVPKRFVDRLTGKRESRLQLVANTFYQMDVFEDISPESFEPKPDVISCIIRLTPKDNGNFFLREFLAQYDKKAKNALRDILMKTGKTKQEALAHIAVQLRPAIQDRRISTLSLHDILAVVEAFTKE